MRFANEGAEESHVSEGQSSVSVLDSKTFKEAMLQFTKIT